MCASALDFFIFLMEKKRPSDEEVTITRMLDKVLRRSDAVDKESLCILAGQRVCIFPQKELNDFHTILTLFSGVAYTVNTALLGRCG
jgi:hypothetical protein